MEDAVIWKKTAPDGVELVIPAQIGGIPVVVDVQAFRDCAYIKTIVIEEGVTSIGDSAFYNCRRLRDVYVPGSVTDFGETDGALFCAGVYGKPCTIHAPAGSKAEELAKGENLLHGVKKGGRVSLGGCDCRRVFTLIDRQVQVFFLP